MESIDKNNNLIEIGKMIEQNPVQEYSVCNDIVNLKNYGANSGRMRTIVGCVCEELKDFISSVELFPDYCDENI